MARDMVLVVLRKIRAWMDREATHAEAEAKKARQFPSMVVAYNADARNYRAMINEIDAVLPRKTKGQS